MDRQKYATAVGAAIRQRRRALGLSTLAVAHGIGVERTVLARIERGLHDPSLSLLLRIARQLDCSLAELLASVE